MSGSPWNFGTACSSNWPHLKTGNRENQRSGTGTSPTSVRVPLFWLPCTRHRRLPAGWLSLIRPAQPALHRKHSSCSASSSGENGASSSDMSLPVSTHKTRQRQPVKALAHRFSPFCPCHPGGLRHHPNRFQKCPHSRHKYRRLTGNHGQIVRNATRAVWLNCSSTTAEPHRGQRSCREFSPELSEASFGERFMAIPGTPGSLRLSSVGHDVIVDGFQCLPESW